MAKKELIKPIFPLKHEFYTSLDRFIHEAGMLNDAVRQIVRMVELPEAAAKILQERLDAFAQARFGDED
jgi:hypothetical protein